MLKLGTKNKMAEQILTMYPFKKKRKKRKTRKKRNAGERKLKNRHLSLKMSKVL